LAEVDRVGPYLTLPRGISFEQETIRWADFALSVIDCRVDVLV
ncbi:PadR family transcriptional regulator, partial [Nocardia asteroides]